MGNTVIGPTIKEKDLGVTISPDMKVSEQCGIAASKGNQILRFYLNLIDLNKKSYFLKFIYLWLSLISCLTHINLPFSSVTVHHYFLLLVTLL